MNLNILLYKLIYSMKYLLLHHCFDSFYQSKKVSDVALTRQNFMHQSRRLYTCCWEFYFYFYLFIALVGLCPCLFSIYRRNHRYFFHLPKYSDCVLIWKNCGKINKQLPVISSAQCSLCLILSSQLWITY